MGRKPNALMLEFFERGPKISDSSNRYHHTCKRCGEQFPKGRIEGLTTHLTKKCPSLSHADRMRVVLRLHDIVDPNEESGQSATTQDATTSGGPENQSMLSAKPQNFNALNVLAEASRRVGGNPQDDGGNAGYGPAAQVQTQAQVQNHGLGHHSHDNDVPVDPQLDTAFAQNFLNDVGSGVSGVGSNSFPTTTAPDLPSLYPFLTTGPPVTQDELSALSMVSTHPPDLSTIAASANETLAHGLMDPGMDMSTDDVSSTLLNLPNHGFAPSRQHFPWPPMSQPLASQSLVQPMSQPMSMSHPVPNAVVAATDPATEVAPDPAPRSTSQMYRPLAMNPYGRTPPPLTEPGAAGTPVKAPKAKSRARFAPERRKEVRELRKVGACMRCRMLKKVCSQETPCQTCAAVETPRLWNHSCVRTKLVEEFPLYFVSPHGIVVYQSLNLVKTQAGLAKCANSSVEGFHFDDGQGQKILFKALKTDKEVFISRVGFPTNDPAESAGLVLLDLETDHVVPKVERYLLATSTEIIGREKSAVIRATLAMAQSIKDAQANNVTDEKNDNLISDIIELWTATCVLADPELQPHFAQISSSTRTSIDEGPPPKFNYTMLSFQFRAAVEKRAGNLCRSVMHHFEQRLLVRNKAHNFETFLTAFILLNCAERMCWLYLRWDRDGEPKPCPWPLDQKPYVYAEKGRHFAKAVHLLLHLRQLEPKIALDASSGLLVPQDHNDSALGLWLASAGFTEDWTSRQDETAEFKVDDCRSLDGTLSGRLLQV